ncbi:hypothetical protein JCGZ_16793 [Jatropha curcas]|uniref:Anthocyanidin 3-O-glucosyltransferase n=1 Tax=Jatropha curcas TaxID=180498 RepID=A0A067L4V3_JATCU|nr:hypothetical protein JCGZ_16793 [Jatropha curcas]
MSYDVDDGIPEGVNHLTIDLAVEVRHFLEQLPYNFERRIEEVLAGTERTTGSRREVTCIMTDAAICSPLGKMAEDMNVPWIAFTVPHPNDLVCYFEMDKIQKLFANAKSENDHIDVIPGLSSLPFKDLPHEIHLSKPSNELVPYLYRMAQKLPQAKALLLNTYEELNPIPLTNYLKLKVKNLLYIGCSTLSITQENDGSSTSAGCLFSWLDRQKVGSVVYISFGTVVELGSEELMALAEAIEYSGKPFLWSLKDKCKENLPEGFLERTKEKGMVVSWAPQREILQHGSVGVFVNHGGYNSMWESVLGGVPMICRSVWADNHINAKVAEEVWGVGVRVEGRVITKSRMVKCLEMIFEQEKAKKMRQACNELRQVLIEADGPDGVAAKNRKTLLHLISG